MAIAYIGSQGLLTATAAMDFGGKAKATATGVIDGFVYIGTAIQAFALGRITLHDWSLLARVPDAVRRGRLPALPAHLAATAEREKKGVVGAGAAASAH